jgi:nitroimidazol reductase NimA-like FMN-containing flavoprotein (pyridoxamine 5'-phosphate oxidase superfamily)
MMRRKDREITDIHEKLAIIDQCKVCRLGLAENGQPYVVPLNFGYTFANNSLILFFHSAPDGRKIDILKSNAKACFEIDCDHELLEGNEPCSHSFAFSSVIGFGTIDLITEPGKKIEALNILMKHQTGKDGPFQYDEHALQAVAVYKINVDEFTGKRR